MAFVPTVFIALFLFNIKNICDGFLVKDEINENIINIEPIGLNIASLIVWPNATVPFFVNPLHFDSDQSLSIMQALSRFSFKTCIKFAPLMDVSGVQHVLIFENPDGIRKCMFNRRGHDADGPHKTILGYDCLSSPSIDMMIMRSLGFPFEHNRALRDIYIDIQYENIEPDALLLFTKDHAFPIELQRQPYDPNSVMHFNERDFSKNGHRTFIFKNYKLKQNRQGLTEGDIKKIEVVYGNECQRRERREKLEVCQKFGGTRTKRDVINLRRSLRVNPDIHPPEIEKQLEEVPSEKAIAKLIEYGIETEVEEIIQKIYNATKVAITHTKNKLCNITPVDIPIEPNLRSTLHFSSSKPDGFGLINNIVDFVNDTINSLASNLTEFCEIKDDKFEIFLTVNFENNKTTDDKEVIESAIKSEVNETIRNRRETKLEDPFEVKSRKYYDKLLKSKAHSNGETEKSTKGIFNKNSEIDKRKIVALSKTNEEFYADRRWPNGIVPYVISDVVPNNYDINDLRKRINEVNRILKKNTCVRLKEITEAEAFSSKINDYLILNTSPDYVTGRVGGRQEFGCTDLFSNGHHRQHTAMMVMAMLGFYFEVSRHDRDQFIRVYNRNIRPDKLHHFELITEDATLSLPYDYWSATHPAWKFWRKTGKRGEAAIATYKSKDPDGSIMKSLGQNEKLLSDIDIIKINSVYKCISE